MVFAMSKELTNLLYKFYISYQSIMICCVLIRYFYYCRWNSRKSAETPCGIKLQYWTCNTTIHKSQECNRSFPDHFNILILQYSRYSCWDSMLCTSILWYTSRYTVPGVLYWNGNFPLKGSVFPVFQMHRYF